MCYSRMFGKCAESLKYKLILTTQCFVADRYIGMMQVCVPVNSMLVRESSNLVPRVFSLFKMVAAREKTLAHQPRPQGLLAFQNGGGSGEDPGTQQITCLQRGWRDGWRCIQNGGYGEKGEKNWVRDVAKVKINRNGGES